MNHKIQLNYSRTLFDRLRQSFILQVTDGKIAIYWSNIFGYKTELFLKLDDPRIKKSKLNFLLASGQESDTI